jgi:MFS family permease
VRRLLAIRDVRVYLAGQGLSMLGDASLWLAMGIWVKQLTGSSSAAGLCWMAFMAPQLAGPIAGLLADRVRRRSLLLGVNLATAAVVLPLLFVDGREDVWLIYAVMVAYGASNAIVGAAQPALLRTIVPEELLPDANGTFQTVREGLRLVAPLAGAGLFAAAGPAAVIALMRVREPRPAPPERHPLADAAEGIRHVWATPILRRTMLACFIAVIAFGFSETALFAVVDAGLHRPAPFLGVLMATQGVSSVLAGAVAARVLRRLGEPGQCVTGLGLFALGCPLLATSHTGTVLAGIALAGCGIPWTMVALNTLLQRMTPLAIQGRVYGAVDMLVAVPQIGAIAGGAVLIATVDHRLVLGAMAALLAAGTLPLLSAAAPGRRAAPARATRPAGPRPTPEPRTAR